MLTGSVLFSTLAGLVTLLAALFAGHPLAVALVSYALAGSCTLLALALGRARPAPQT